jgi:hypothetical protein
MDADLQDRIDTAVAVAYGQHGYLAEDGAFDIPAMIDKLTALVLTAEVFHKKERASKGITRRRIMEHMFSQVPGPETWAEQEDPELAEGVYKTLDTACWRQMAITPSAPVQSRLNGEHTLVLCRTKVNPNQTDAVYVTRDLGCLIEDAIKHQRASQKKRADNDAAFTAMLIERVPEHGKKFNRELIGGLTTALNSAKAISAGALQIALAEAEAEAYEADADEADADE